jgi:hypothetical protein
MVLSSAAWTGGNATPARADAARAVPPRVRNSRRDGGALREEVAVPEDFGVRMDSGFMVTEA